MLQTIPSSVVIVTGSRSLDKSEHEESARKRIRDCLAFSIGVASGLHLFVGDASGPDAWAREIARELDVPVWEFVGLTGEIRTPAGRAKWISDKSLRNLDTRSRLLARNRQMTSIASLSDNVRILGLVDAQSKTKGAIHTIQCAESVGIRAWRIEYGG